MSCLYETCLSDVAWKVIELIFPAYAKRGRPRVYSLRSIVNLSFVLMIDHIFLLTKSFKHFQV
ncbi:MAG: hypothetical protein KC505_03865 [Myxococcales bacterium]|nr:hypothetical protein [Myxococcales bacterium]USN50276.1 MAG: hypothetical protein H6731_08400 [Myxococcales bacterium]